MSNRIVHFDKFDDLQIERINAHVRGSLENEGDANGALIYVTNGLRNKNFADQPDMKSIHVLKNPDTIATALLTEAIQCNNVDGVLMYCQHLITIGRTAIQAINEELTKRKTQN